MKIKSIIDDPIYDLFSFKYESEEDDFLIKTLNKIHTLGPIDSSDFEKLALLKKFRPEIFKKYEAKLISLMGLFYKTQEPESLIEEIYSIYAAAIKEEFGEFTPVQADVYKKILDKKYFSFSAPTSIGKSYLFRELIKDAKTDVVIVVPSRSLISEYISALIKIVDKSELVMEFIEVVNTKYAKKRIFVITPERGVELFKNLHKLNIELFLFDEAQISEEEIRGMRFDSLVRRIDRLVPNARKVFTHPFIDNPEAQLKKHGFEINSDSKKYEQNSVGKIYLSVTPKKEFSYFSPFTKERNIKADNNIAKDLLSSNGTVLIYVSKEKIYDGRFNKEFSEYIDLCPKITNPDALKYINWLREFIGASDSKDKNSTMINMMERGIVFHHGSMPLKARLLIEEFVNKNFAKICFATSTLSQGINMPFNIVWINNYKFNGSESQRVLSLKNLIGRSGRVSNTKNSFDYGYVILEEENVDSFCARLSSTSTISEVSKLDDILEIGEDMLDIVDAIRDNTFDDELQLTDSQVDRLKKANNDDCIKFIFDRLLIDQKAITASDYYAISKKDRVRIKEDFKKIFISHLRRNELTLHEQYILSTSIPILLWQIQGKSFSEIISLRYAFLSKKDDRRKIDQQLKKGEITQETAKKEIKKLTIKYSPPAASIPILKAKKLPEAPIEDGAKKSKGPPGLYPHRASVEKIKYDRLVYDTYDYIDKVISLSLRDPISAALLIYYQKTGDERAVILSNYLKYGTNDNKEIWLIKYGFSFDEIEWLKDYVDSVDETEIIFKNDIKSIEQEKLQLVERFIN